MPRYRVKSGKIRLRMKNGKGKEISATTNDVINISPELATKYKSHLLPMGPDAYFIDELDEFSEMNSRETNMRIMPIDGEEGFYNVFNTITKTYVNNSPLTKKDAMKLVKGINVNPVFIEEGLDVDDEEDENKEDGGVKASSDNNGNNNDDEEDKGKKEKKDKKDKKKKKNK